VRACIVTKYGGPEVLQVQEIEKPVPTQREVLVKVYAVSINDWDWGLLQGKTLLDRMMSGLSKPKKNILGSDIAGKIEAVGSGVTQFKVGDEVYGDLSGKWGGFAEYVCTEEKKLALKPMNMSFEEAAAIPQAGMLALQGLIDYGKIRKGEKILINGAGGGVGVFGIQIAKTFGAEVTVVDSKSKLEMLRTTGADHVIDYRKTDFTQMDLKYDLILDTKSNRSIFSYLRTLNKGGRYITVGGDLRRVLYMFFLSPYVALLTSKKLRVVVLKPNKDLNYFNEEFSKGRIKPFIGHVYSLAEIGEAFRLYGKAEHKGKIVIRVAHEL
jgi:NADPH:quinone reductase-like Zn-dependent oxidoreductase